MTNAFQRFCNGLHHIRHELNEEITEMLAFAEVMARKQNSLELDENGFFYTTAAGPLEEIIPTMYKQIERLERIKKQRDTSM
jgi:signal transduction histidine kinase